MADWTTLSSLATAAGTLVLAGATFSAVRSSNASARVAEQALQEQRRPLLVHARLDDPVQKIMFADGHWIHVEGSQAVVEEANGVVYLGLAVRNAGAGIAVLQGWRAAEGLVTGTTEAPRAEDFQRQSRDIYVGPGDIGLWQGALRDPDAEVAHAIGAALRERRAFTLDLLFSDQVGLQRTISRFSVAPVGEDRWLGSAGRHWNLDTPGAR